MSPVIVDANVLFSALISAGNKAASILITPPATIRLVSCHFIQIELFKHKERIKHLSGLDDDTLIDLLYEFSSHIEFINEAYIPFICWQQANRLLENIDPNDIPYLALAIHLDAPSGQVIAE
ncbi:PIN domain-containing protein [Spirosoma linguale]|uniref:PIN domain-containing protein n=1 Tax=Spirosoma linguale (strain ATCC 33905 / DSM 74 / LMG 10896 / Claus 1) TaxID=504472 RepID=D2QDA4_SPILD|nr:hypothetical protein Slin_0269 [Spirosoma linguale DSM 74]